MLLFALNWPSPAKMGGLGFIGLLFVLWVIYAYVLPRMRAAPAAGVGAVSAGLGVVTGAVGAVGGVASDLTGIDPESNAAARRLEDLEEIKGITPDEILEFIKSKKTINEVYKELADRRIDLIPIADPPFGS